MSRDSCVDDTGSSTVVLSMRHITGWCTERATHHGLYTECAAHRVNGVRHITGSTYRNERAVKNGASVKVREGSVN